MVILITKILYSIIRKSKEISAFYFRRFRVRPKLFTIRKRYDSISLVYAIIMTCSKYIILVFIL